MTAGTITLTVKEEDPVEVEITEGMTLSQVADAINASDAEVFASLVHDGTNYFLQVSAKESGHVIGGNPRCHHHRRKLHGRGRDSN